MLSMYESAQFVQFGARRFARAVLDPTCPMLRGYWVRVAESHWRALTPDTALCARIDAALDNHRTNA